MRIAKVIGTVTLGKVHPSMTGARFKLAIPLSASDLDSTDVPSGEDLVVYDDMGAGLGDRIMLSEGGEAAQPFLPELKPVDAYNAGLLDEINLPDLDDSR